MERFDQVVDRALVAFVQRVFHAADEFGLERVLLVHPLVVDAVVRAAAILGQVVRQPVVVEESIVCHAARSRQSDADGKREGDIRARAPM